jgi:hypothetical protein
MTKSSDQYELIPPYCPNPQCLFHFGSEEKFYAKNGFSIALFLLSVMKGRWVHSNFFKGIFMSDGVVTGVSKSIL